MAEPDVKDVLQKLLGAVSNRSEAASASGPKSWWPTLVIFIVGAIAACVYGFSQWQRRMRLAKLEHEATVRSVEKANAMVAMANAADVEQVTKARAVVEASSRKLDAINDALVAIQAAKETDDAAIDRIRSWADLAPPK